MVVNSPRPEAHISFDFRSYKGLSNGRSGGDNTFHQSHHAKRLSPHYLEGGRRGGHQSTGINSSTSGSGFRQRSPHQTQSLLDSDFGLSREFIGTPNKFVPLSNSSSGFRSSFQSDSQPIPPISEASNKRAAPPPLISINTQKLEPIISLSKATSNQQRRNTTATRPTPLLNGHRPVASTASLSGSVQQPSLLGARRPALSRKNNKKGDSSGGDSWERREQRQNTEYNFTEVEFPSLVDGNSSSSSTGIQPLIEPINQTGGSPEDNPVQFSAVVTGGRRATIDAATVKLARQSASKSYAQTLKT